MNGVIIEAIYRSCSHRANVDIDYRYIVVVFKRRTHLIPAAWYPGYLICEYEIRFAI